LQEEREARPVTDRPTTPPAEDGPSKLAVRNVRLALLQLLESDEELRLAVAGTVEAETDLKAHLHHLLTTDEEIKAAVLALVPKPMPATLERLGASDAEHAQNVVELIEEKLRQTLRPDAFRRPTFVR
jgi:hypothetical protein